MNLHTPPNKDRLDRVDMVSDVETTPTFHLFPRRALLVSITRGNFFPNKWALDTPCTCDKSRSQGSYPFQFLFLVF